LEFIQEFPVIVLSVTTFLHVQFYTHSAQKSSSFPREFIGEVRRWGSGPEILKFPQRFYWWSLLMWESGH